MRKHSSRRATSPALRPQPVRGKNSEASAARIRATDWILKLYVAGQTPNSITAISNLKRICEEHLKGRYHIQVVDLLVDPTLSEADQIVAIPTLVRKLPLPIRKIIGNLSNTDRTLVGLQLKPAKSATVTYGEK